MVRLISLVWGSWDCLGTVNFGTHTCDDGVLFSQRLFFHPLTLANGETSISGTGNESSCYSCVVFWYFGILCI